MERTRWVVLGGIVGLALVAWRAQSCRQESAARDREPPKAAPCFTATSDLPGDHAAMRAVFRQTDREGNGETWYAILRTELDHCAFVMDTTAATGDGGVTGEQILVRYRGRRTWISFDPEAGGVLICSADRSLLHHIRTTYEQATTDATELRKLIAAVPKDRWDD